MKIKKIVSSILVMAMLLTATSIIAFAETAVLTATPETVASVIASAGDGDTVMLSAGTYSPITISNKNITLEGETDENGALLAEIVGGNPAITAHGFSGTIKNIKVTNAFKVLYGEPIKDFVADGLYITGATYGLHPVAYQSDLTWIIQNCYMDLSWANSCGVYKCEAPTIIFKNNVFASTNPHYPDYGAPIVNTAGSKTIIEENIFGENTKIQFLTQEAASGVEFGNNYYADGVENVIVSDNKYEVAPITSWYVNEEKTIVKTAPRGTFDGGMVNIDNPEQTFITTSISNLKAYESIVLKIYDANDTLLATTVAAQKTIDANLGACSVVTHITKIDDWWETTWEDGKLRADYVPAYGILYVDDIEMNKAAIRMIKASGEQAINWADVPGVADVPVVAEINGEKYTTLEEAFAAATETDTIELLTDASPSLTSQRAITKAAIIDLGGKTLTLTEDDLYFGTTTFKNGNIIVDSSVKPSTAVFWMFANQTLTFDNVKITATGVSGTYLIGLNGDNADLNLINGSEIIADNETALDLDIICVNASTGNDILIENSKVSVKNLDGKVFFRGNYTVKGTSEINLSGITKAGFRIEAGQTLSIEDTATVDIVGEPRDGGIHLTDVSSVYNKADTAIVNASINRPTAFTTTYDGGYWTNANKTEKVKAEVVFNAVVNNYAEVGTNYGMYIYIPETAEENRINLNQGTEDLATSEGAFHTYITEIPASEFETEICVMPYVIINEVPVYGDILTVSANEFTKYLGRVTE